MKIKRPKYIIVLTVVFCVLLFFAYSILTLKNLKVIPFVELGFWIMWVVVILGIILVILFLINLYYSLINYQNKKNNQGN
jgi:hypothetical protein